MVEAARIRDPDGTEGRDRWLRKPAVDPAAQVPLLADAMVAAAITWTASFCSLSASEGEVTFKGLRAARVGDLPLRQAGLPIYAALRVPAWDAVAGLGLDRDVVATVVEAFFGGDGDPKADDRPVSPVEMRIVDVIGGQVVAALTAAFAAVQPVRIEFDRTLPKADCSFLGKPLTPLLAATFELKTIGRTVALDVLLPQAAIDLHATAFADANAVPPVRDDASWAHQLKGEVSRAALRVEAAIAMRPMSLGDLAALRPGQLLELPAGAGGNVTLRCGTEALFRCHLGQSDGFYTLRVGDALERAPQPSRKDR